MAVPVSPSEGSPPDNPIIRTEKRPSEDWPNLSEDCLSAHEREDWRCLVASLDVGRSLIVQGLGAVLSILQGMREVPEELRKGLGSRV